MSEDIVVIVPKFLKTFKNLLGLYEQKSRGAVIKPNDFIAAFEGISKSDVEQAVKVFKTANQTRQTLQGVINFQPATNAVSKELVTLPDQNKLQTASHVLEALVKTATQNKYPSAEELLKTLKITDKDTQKQFIKVYDQAIKDTKKTYEKNPIDANLYRWAKFGQFFFYGGTVLLILIMLWKIYEGIVYVTREFRRTLAKIIEPKGRMSYFKLWHWKKEKKSKKHSKSQPIILNTGYIGEQNIQRSRRSKDDSDSEEFIADEESI